jgi:hypothetical protein
MKREWLHLDLLKVVSKGRLAHWHLLPFPDTTQGLLWEKVRKASLFVSLARRQQEL